MISASSDQNPLASLKERLQVAGDKPGVCIRLSREITRDSLPDAQPIRASFLTSFNLESAAPFLVVESARAGLLLTPWFGPFGQLEQPCLDPGSSFYQSNPDVVVLGLRLEDAAPDLVFRFLSLKRKAIAGLIGDVTARLSDLVSNIRQRSRAKILIFNFSQPRYLAAGIGDSMLPENQMETICKLNRRLKKITTEFPNVQIFDSARLLDEIGIRNRSDEKLEFLGRIPFGIEAQFRLANGMARWFRALYQAPCKCLVTDLDNTLWGGVIGEDGMGGIHLGEDYPGNVFKAFQRHLLMLRDRGILLAIASKNNREDALEVLRDHPDSILRPEHFSAMEIHWNDKASSLQSIAETLNIGIGSLTFFDDNPVERDWIRTRLPEVTVFDVPDDPTQFRDTLSDSGAFDSLSITREDQNRAEMYQQEAERTNLIRESSTVEAFLADLKMILTIGPVNEDTLQRCAQLIGKTNQFNLTTRRHPAGALEEMITGGAIALWVRVKDRFGDQGLVGVAIALPLKSKAIWKIDTFLLSCRVLGRGVETALLSCLITETEKNGGQEILGEYVPSAQNKPASDFFQRHGFEHESKDSSFWRLELVRGTVSIPDFLTLQLEGLD